MHRIPRTRTFYLGASVLYALVVFGVIEAFYDWELARAGLLVGPVGLLALVDQTVSLHLASLALWTAFSLVAGEVAYRFDSRLSTALGQAEQRGAELGLISELSAGLTGPLGPAEVAAAFLAGIRRVVPPAVTSALIVYEEAAEAFRSLAEDGPRAGSLHGQVHPIAVLPVQMRERLIGEHRSFVIPDTGLVPEWPAFGDRFPAMRGVRAAAALPLVSRSRLIGAILLRGDAPGAFDRDQLQLLALLGQYVAGALHNALNLAEAEARADRESVVNRVAGRLRASLSPEEVIAGATEEVGRALGVSRAIVCTGSTREDLEVLHAWHADGVPPLAVGTRGQTPLAVLAAREGRTIAVRDERDDPRLADPTLGSHELIDQGTIAGLATPIGLGGQLSGVLLFRQVGSPRGWTSAEVRLIEAVARELRVAIESARLFQARQREAERMLALQRASAALTAQTDPQIVVAEILKAAVSLLGAGSGSLFRWDQGAGVLRNVQSWNLGSLTIASLRPGQGVVGRAFTDRAPCIVNDYQHWDGAPAAARAGGLRAAMAVPLIRQGQPIGSLVLTSYDANFTFTADDGRLLTLFADQAVASITAAEAFEQQGTAVAELRRLSQAKSDFVSIVSHEFRTPLTGIQGFSEMMRDEDLTLAEMKEYAGDINKDAQRLNRMINEMLDLDRLESGRMALETAEVDLNALITEVAGGVLPGEADHPIRLRLDPGLGPVAGDRDKLTQVVVNLLSNAIKYSPGGGEIVVTSRAEGPSAHVLVRDRGMGIPADGLEKVFERFTRLESNATRFIQGTGLGLPIVRQIVALHGGRAWVESTVGEGSVFQFTIPLAPPAGV